MSAKDYRYPTLESRDPKTAACNNPSCQACSPPGSAEHGQKGHVRRGMFRLLTLNPGVQGSPISCELQVFPICTSQPYEALSYVWGDPSVTKEIKLMDKPFQITVNLETALQHLRISDKKRRLWVDAICIDQKNLDERSEQVQMMAKIYAGAWRVLAWLGEADQYTEIAFDTVDDMCSVAKYRIWQYCSAKIGVPMRDLDDMKVARTIIEDASSGESSPFYMLQLLSGRMVPFCTAMMRTHSKLCTGKIAIDEASLSAMERFFSADNRDPQFLQDVERYKKGLLQVFCLRPWWRRVWVVQEAVSAKWVAIICGTREVNLDQLDLAFFGFMDYRFSNSCHAKVNRDLRGPLGEPTYLAVRRLSKRFSDTLGSLLHAFLDRECTDPRDKIFALLNLAQSHTVTVDYTRPYVEVYTEATRSIMQASQTMSISCMIPGSAPRITSLLEKSLPTWVPDFSQQFLGDQLVTIDCPLEQQDYRASMKPAPHDTVSVEYPRVLKLYIVLCDEVETVHDRIHHWAKRDMGDENGIREKLQQWMPDEKAAYPTGESRTDAFWRTLIQDRYNYDNGTENLLGKNGRTSHHDRITLKNLFSHSTGIANGGACDDNSGTELFDQYPYTQSDFQKDIRGKVKNKTFCITTRGYTGMIAGDVQVGDKVCIARGSPVPLIIRPLEDETMLRDIRKPFDRSELWTLVGPAYIHGIMDGEIEAAADRGEFQEEIVYLA